MRRGSSSGPSEETTKRDVDVRDERLQRVARPAALRTMALRRGSTESTESPASAIQSPTATSVPSWAKRPGMRTRSTAGLGRHVELSAMDGDHTPRLVAGREVLGVLGSPAERGEIEAERLSGACPLCSRARALHPSWRIPRATRRENGPGPRGPGPFQLRPGVD